MTDLTDRERWNAKYSGRTFDARIEPSPFFVRILPDLKKVLPERPVVLDIATGIGRNAVYLAAQGMSVTGIDVSPVGLELAGRLAEHHGVDVRFEEADLEHASLPREHYDLVVNCMYLQRTLFPAMRETLKPGGFVAYETPCRSTGAHPMRADFLLRPNELLEAFAGFHILLYEELPADDSGLARILARKPAP